MNFNEKLISLRKSKGLSQEVRQPLQESSHLNSQKFILTLS